MRTRRWILEISSWGTTTARSLCDFAQHAGQEDGTVPVPEHCFYLWRNSGCHLFRLFQEHFLHCTCSFSRTFCHFFDGTASVPRFSDCMRYKSIVSAHMFCQHRAFVKMTFHFRTVPPAVVSTHVSFTVMPGRSVQWHYWNYSNIATNIFFFRFKKLST